MSVIQMADGTRVLACVKPGQMLTEEDKRILAEWVQFCRDRRAEEQRKRNAELLPGGKL
jgi:hypothetical protein